MIEMKFNKKTSKKCNLFYLFIGWIAVSNWNRMHLPSHFICEPSSAYSARHLSASSYLPYTSNVFTKGTIAAWLVRALVNLTFRHFSVHNCFGFAVFKVNCVAKCWFNKKQSNSYGNWSGIRREYSATDKPLCWIVAKSVIGNNGIRRKWLCRWAERNARLSVLFDSGWSAISYLFDQKPCKLTSLAHHANNGLRLNRGKYYCLFASVHYTANLRFNQRKTKLYAIFHWNS